MAHKTFTANEKRLALEQVLASETFARSDQLRRFLQYVCETEIDGRAAELNEYMIGVDVLHRPKGYSPGADSSVRSRAYELRQRLKRYYEKEAPDAPLQIDIPRGSYVPVFLDPSVPTQGDSLVPEVDEDEPEPPVKPRKQPGTWLVLCLSAVAISATLAAGYFWIRTLPSTQIDPAVREAWGPLTGLGANVQICIGSGLHMLVRPSWQQAPGGPPRFKALPELYPIYRKQRELKPDAELFMHPTENSLDFGEMKAAVAVAGMLHALGAEYHFLPERVTSIGAVRGRNTILFGSSQTSMLAHQQLQRARWTIDFDIPLNRVVVIDQKDKAHSTPFVGDFGKAGEPSWCCGLITVLPAEGADSRAVTVVISGVTPTGVEAAIEFFSSAASMRDLRQRFLREGLSGFPKAYQVVVKCRSTDTFLQATGYVAHHVLER